MTIRHFVVMQNDYPTSIVLGTREEAAEFEAQLKKNENQQKRYYHLHEFEPKYIKGNKMRERADVGAQSIRIMVLNDIQMSDAEERFMKKNVENNLKEHKNSGGSPSGKALALAVEHCEKERLPYEVQAYPGQGYILYLLDRKTGERK
jgi:NTP pyrophosphatase (non-canonical NTP hydrolase)